MYAQKEYQIGGLVTASQIYIMCQIFANVSKKKFCKKRKFSISNSEIADNQTTVIFKNSKSFPKLEIWQIRCNDA